MNQQNRIQTVAVEKIKLIYRAKQYICTLTMKAAKLDLHSAVMELDEKR